MPEPTNLTIQCPNCNMEAEAPIPPETTKQIFGQCSFCDTKYRYDVAEKEATLVVPASQQQYLYVHLNL